MSLLSVTALIAVACVHDRISSSALKTGGIDRGLDHAGSSSTLHTSVDKCNVDVVGVFGREEVVGEHSLAARELYIADADHLCVLLEG